MNSVESAFALSAPEVSVGVGGIEVSGIEVGGIEVGGIEVGGIEAASTRKPRRSRSSPVGRQIDGLALGGLALGGLAIEGLASEGPKIEGPRRPFIKWAGGKRQLLPELRRHVPTHQGRYFEPFVGGGALFFELRPAAATLTDVNERLIRTYLGVRDDVEQVIALLRSYEQEHEQAFFYRLRDQNIDTETNARVAAWFIYLNKVGFNGLYRVNRQNRFNVPFGRHKNPTICDEATLRACSAALSRATIEVSDFEAAVASAVPGDVVYFDPPYVPLSVTSSFTSYTSSGFGSDAQRRLRDLARNLKQRGVHVLLSNSSAESVRELYAEGFTLTEVSATRLVNSKATGRGAITELVIT